MLIWLPPSEGKNAPAQGPSLDVNALSRAGLATSRRTVCDTLTALGDGPEAAAILKVGVRIDLSVNTALDSAPCAPASSLSMSASQDAEYGETTTWARWRSLTSEYPVEAMVRLRAPTKFSEPSARVEGP